jgi:four helix bundle protein
MESGDATDGRIRSFRDLIVWQRARQLARASQALCDRLPQRVHNWLGDQILRASFSITGNIAEGRGRLSKAENVKHLLIARGSLNELESHVEQASDLGYVTFDATKSVRDLATEVGRMLNAQIRKLSGRRLR